MRLEDFMEEEIADFHTVKPSLPKGLFVIGTCGKCKFYKNDGNYSNCIFDDVYEPVGPAYGCIHWEKKQ